MKWTLGQIKDLYTQMNNGHLLYYNPQKSYQEMMIWYLYTICILYSHTCHSLFTRNIICVFAGDNIHLKILVPSVAAGAIIGKGGETIAAVQKEAGARVKMSKATDFYPGKKLWRY